MFVLVQKDYVVVPTRNASRWKNINTRIIYETETLEDAARTALAYPLRADVDIFLYLKDESEEAGYRPTTLDDLDKYYAFREEIKKGLV